MLEFIQANFQYLIIPIVAAIVGWSTNWIAIQMTFYPVEPIGNPPMFGWQGIIPSKAAKMGEIATDSVLAKLGSLQEVFDAMEPDVIGNHVVGVLEPQIETYVDGIMLEDNPEWDLLPGPAKAVFYTMVKRKLPTTVQAITADVRENIENMIDLKAMVVKQVEDNKEMANRIFLECGAEEFKFIINSGFYFGFALGVVQALIWWYVQRTYGTFDAAGVQTSVAAWWLLPLFGLLVGYLTNFLALRIIFKPVQPRKIGPITLHGLFLRRQDEVAEIWCDIVTREILTIRNVIDAMLNGSKSEVSQAVIKRHIRRTAEEILGPTKPLVQLTMGLKNYMELHDTGTEAAVELSLHAFDDPAFNASRAVIVKQMMVERMQALSSEEFQMLLRPAFEEDEIKLIALGALLGLAAGLIQVWPVIRAAAAAAAGG